MVGEASRCGPEPKSVVQMLYILPMEFVSFNYTPKKIDIVCISKMSIKDPVYTITLRRPDATSFYCFTHRVPHDLVPTVLGQIGVGITLNDQC